MSATLAELRHYAERATFAALRASRAIDKIPIGQSDRFTVQMGHFNRAFNLYKAARREIERREQVAA